jgi:hypothetical protein
MRKYLKAFGPATATDFSLWSGMTLREAREIWARQQSRLSAVNVQGWKADILREDLDRLVEARLEQPLVRLLPYFDTFLLGHKERDHLVPTQHKPSVYRAQGWIAPAVLVNGRVVAVWEYLREGDRLQVKVSKFQSLSRSTAAGIREETQRLGRFLGTPRIDLQF